MVESDWKQPSCHQSHCQNCNAKHTFFSTYNDRSRLCKQYDEISDKVQEMPNNTADLVALTRYLEHASTALVMKLQTQVDEAAERLVFLLDYATLSCELLSDYTLGRNSGFKPTEWQHSTPLEGLINRLTLDRVKCFFVFGWLCDYCMNVSDEDIKLNSTVFHWPQHIQKIFELSRNRVGHRRDLAMDDLRKR